MLEFQIGTIYVLIGKQEAKFIKNVYILSINDSYFHTNIDSIYPSEVEIKDIVFIQSTSFTYVAYTCTINT